MAGATNTTAGILSGSWALATATYSADVIVYGLTPGGMTAAYEARRQGLSVIAVSGWRERRLGGMTTGGLGNSDMGRGNAFGGLSRRFFRDANLLIGRVDDGVTYPFSSDFGPETARSVFESWCVQMGIQVIYTSGVDIVYKTGTVINSIRTVDGKTFAGKAFIDSSYEGDLLAKAGCSYIVGREAANSDNPQNGYTGPQSIGIRALVDPFVTPGNPASGLIYGVNSIPALAIGAADGATQAFCFRQTVVTSAHAADYAPMPTTPPRNYDPARYEMIGRYLDAIAVAGLTPAISDVLGNIAGVEGWIMDINSGGLMSLDNAGMNWGYPDGTYAQREVIWQQHIDYQRGFWHHMQWSTDPRIVNSGLQATMRLYGYSSKSYLSGTHPDDPAFWSAALYVREARRLITDFPSFTLADQTMVDGTTPRSTNTIAVGNYVTDSHGAQRLATFNGTRWAVQYEGVAGQQPGGVNQQYPIPYEIAIPKRAECTNLWVTFCLAGTHSAFSSLRMEPVHMVVGQACGMGASIAIKNSLAAQDVPGATLRSSLLAAPDPVAPLLPQVN